MKALILVGGYGTRLRPLTLSVPKPLVPFANKPILVHQIEALKQVGVDEVVLAINYQPKIMLEEMRTLEEKFNIKITCSQERVAMGTAGPLALARDILTEHGNELFFVFNSDVICEYPLQDMLQFHKKHGKEGTLMVTKVEEPSKYGVVVTNEDGQIQRFVEKPKVFVGNRINAGIYLFHKNILDRIEMKPTSIEKEIFPKMAADHNLYAMDLDGFWMDIGQPKDFLSGTQLYLTALANKKHQSLAKKPENNEYKIIGDTVLIASTAKIGKGCVVGPNVVIGENVVIGDGVRLQKTVLMDNVVVGNHSWLNTTIVGWNSTIGKWVRTENTTVLGEDVTVSDELYINGGKVLPHKGVNDSILHPDTILM